MTLDEAKTEYLLTRATYEAACKLGRDGRNRRWDAYRLMVDAQKNLIDVAADKACMAEGVAPLSGEDYEAAMANAVARQELTELSLRLEA